MIDLSGVVKMAAEAALRSLEGHVYRARSEGRACHAH